MDNAESLLAIAVGLPLAGLLFFHLWPRLRREAFQQDVFAIRNDLHEFVAARGLPFEDAAYRDVRDTLNGAIRWVREMSGVNVLLIMLLAGQDSERSTRDKTTSINELQQAVTEARQKLAIRFLRYWLLCPSTWLVGMPICAVLLLARFVSGRIPAFRSWNAVTFPVSRAFMNESKMIGQNPEATWLTFGYTNVH